MNYFVYILRSTSNELYIGQTNDLPTRIKEHIKKYSKAAKFTKDGAEFYLEYFEEFDSRLKSMRREKQLKGWTRAKKEALIKGDLTSLKLLSKKKKI